MTLFGLFVFGSNSTLIYRFLTDDLLAYLQKCFLERGLVYDDKLPENNQEYGDVAYSLDDVIALHFSTILQFYSLTSYRHSPIKRITVQSNKQVFFDQIGENPIVCMTDESFDTMIIFKTIHLFKALVRFHLGASPFIKSKIVENAIDRISASLQYYLNNITISQALLFESCEYLHINALIRQQCLEACTLIIPDVQASLHASPTIMLITCNDKVVYMHLSNDQNRPSNSDLFLLLLNNTSRSLRHQFQSEEDAKSSKTAHIYRTKINDNDDVNLTRTNSARQVIDDIHISQIRRAQSLPMVPLLASKPMKDNYRTEVIFIKTSNRILAPFTMLTITLTDNISALVLVEWKSSLACGHLSELIGHLDLYTTELRFPYDRLLNLVKSVENNITIRRYFESRKVPVNTFSTVLNETQAIYKSIEKRMETINDGDQKGNQILTNLEKMKDKALEMFHRLFFDSEEYALSHRSNDIPPELSLIQTLREKLLMQLRDWFSFIEIKSQRNITMSLCHDGFPGLVHFALIDRSRGHICTPALFASDFQHHQSDGMELFVEKKILAFEMDCLAALQRGCTSYTMTDDHFTYNYTLRLQESNGASMRLYKPFVRSHPPGILHFDFYKALAYENYSSLVDQTSTTCFELICVHLRIIPSSRVRDQCEQLWPRLMELDE